MIAHLFRIKKPPFSGGGSTKHDKKRLFCCNKDAYTDWVYYPSILLFTYFEINLVEF